MIDFACKEFDLDEIIRCGFSITKAEYKILNFFISNSDEWYTTDDVAKKLELNLSTIQRGVKKLHEEKVIERRQNNLSGGGYTFVYKCESKPELRKLLIEIIHSWAKRVEIEINHW